MKKSKQNKKPRRIKIGSKTPNKITEDTIHKVKVIDRKRQIALQKLDNEIEAKLAKLTRRPLPVHKTAQVSRTIWQRVCDFFDQFRP